MNDDKIKEIQKNGFAINKKSDIMLYSYDYAYTMGMNTNSKNGIVLPELFLTGVPSMDGARILNTISMAIFKMGLPEGNFIYKDIEGLDKINILLVEIKDIDKVRSLIKDIENANNEINGKGLQKIYQVIISDGNKKFNLKEPDEELDIYFDIDTVDLSKITPISIPRVNKKEHLLLFKAQKFLSKTIVK